MRLVVFWMSLSSLLSLVCAKAKFVLSSSVTEDIQRLSQSQNAQLQQICGRFGKVRRKFRLMIDGGESANPGQFPWAAALSQQASKGAFCSATLISDRHIITAAHCFFSYSDLNLPCKGPKEKNLKSLVVNIGGVCVDKSNNCGKIDVIQRRIKQFATLDKFNEAKCMKGDDLAIAELDQPVEFNNNLRPVCLPQKDEPDLDHKDDYKFYSLGFGRVSSEPIASRLFYFVTKILSYFKPDILTAKSINNEARICGGDSGGGIVTRKGNGPFKVVGVHSFALDCDPGEPDRKYMSTLISKHLDQICRLTGICTQTEKRI